MTEDMVGDRLLFGLRLAVVVIAAVAVGVLGLRQLLMYAEAYSVLPAQFVALAVLGAVVAAAAVGSRRRGVAVTAVLAACAVSYLALSEGVATYADWAYGAGNWAGLAVLIERPLRTQAAFLAAHGGLALANLVLLTDVDRDSLLRFATGSVGVFGYPLCVALVAAPLREIARRAAASAGELERVRTAEAVAVESDARRRRQVAELGDSAVPLLAGLAAGTLDPADERVVRRCAVEAARMRRLFAELDVVADPLLHELRHCADVADRKGVMVELEAHGQVPALPLGVRRCLTDAALTVLTTAESWARVTVVGTAGLVSVNVFADSGPADLRRPAEPGISLDTRASDDTFWVEVRWQPV